MNVAIPSLDNIHLKKLESIINAEFETIEITCNIEAGQKELDCFNVVKNRVKNSGGRMILGWQIWLTDILIEAEAHAVWENEQEELHDISPKGSSLSFDKIVFIEDPRMTYEEKQIQNIRLNITKNSVVDDFIKLAKLFFHLQNKGERANHHDLSKILDNDQIQEIKNVYNWKLKLQGFIDSGNNEKSLCFCGGSKIYKNCHKKELEKITKNRI